MVRIDTSDPKRRPQQPILMALRLWLPNSANVVWCDIEGGGLLENMFGLMFVCAQKNILVQNGMNMIELEVFQN